MKLLLAISFPEECQCQWHFAFSHEKKAIMRYSAREISPETPINATICRLCGQKHPCEHLCVAPPSNFPPPLSQKPPRTTTSAPVCCTGPRATDRPGGRVAGTPRTAGTPPPSPDHPDPQACLNSGTLSPAWGWNIENTPFRTGSRVVSRSSVLRTHTPCRASPSQSRRWSRWTWTLVRVAQPRRAMPR